MKTVKGPLGCIVFLAYIFICIIVIIAIVKRSFTSVFGKNMTSLYNISEDITKITAAMEAAETVEEQDEIAKQRDSLQMDFNTKIENVLKVMRDAETDAVKLKSEAVRLTQLAESKTKLAERLKTYVSTILQIQGIQKLDLDLFKLSFRPSDTLEIVDEELVPDSFKEKIVTESIKIDKTKIKSYIKESNEWVPGTKLITKQNLQIK